MTSASPVDDGRWHLVTLTAGGNTQALYLDGNQVGSQSGTVQIAGQANNYVGAGYNGGSWPDEQFYGSSAAYPEYFNGDISDVAFWNRQLTNAEALTLYADGTTPAALLTKVTRPSGSVYAQLELRPADRPGHQRHRQQRRHLAAAPRPPWAGPARCTRPRCWRPPRPATTG